jgi:hypothetical protein
MRFVKNVNAMDTAIAQRMPHINGRAAQNVITGRGENIANNVNQATLGIQGMVECAKNANAMAKRRFAIHSKLYFLEINIF